MQSQLIDQLVKHDSILTPLQPLYPRQFYPFKNAKKPANLSSNKVLNLSGKAAGEEHLPRNECDRHYRKLDMTLSFNGVASKRHQLVAQIDQMDDMDWIKLVVL